MDICLQGDTGLIMCTESESEGQPSTVAVTGGGERTRGAGQVTRTQSEGSRGFEGRDTALMDIWASSALGGTSASLEEACCGLADTEGLVDRPDSAWLSSSSSSSFSSSSGPSESSPSESWRSVLLK